MTDEFKERMREQLKQWKEELKQACAAPPRVLIREQDDGPDREDCVMCATPTKRWLQPENAPICSQGCLDAYLKDPSVYDPRGLYPARRVTVSVPACKTCIFIDTSTCRTCVRPQMSNHIPRSS